MYDYKTERPSIFTEAGVKHLLEMLDQIEKACNKAGSVEIGDVGGSWPDLAAIDYLEERGLITVERLKPTQSSVIRLRRRT